MSVILRGLLSQGIILGWNAFRPAEPAAGGSSAPVAPAPPAPSSPSHPSVGIQGSGPRAVADGGLASHGFPPAATLPWFLVSPNPEGAPTPGQGQGTTSAFPESQNPAWATPCRAIIHCHSFVKSGLVDTEYKPFLPKTSSSPEPNPLLGRAGMGEPGRGTRLQEQLWHNLLKQLRVPDALPSCSNAERMHALGQK